jgi:hypothetical protein
MIWHICSTIDRGYRQFRCVMMKPAVMYVLAKIRGSVISVTRVLRIAET